jgi:tripartite-type tricarboxylate transporter receptor subunit TctC
MLTRRHAVRIAAASALAPTLSSRFALAQQGWPRRPVRLIVPFAPGGGTDAVARIISTRLSDIWGQQMVIENRGGAGSNIGIEAVARAEPDGHSVLIASLPFAINRYIYPSVNYDPVADFAPVTLICRYPNLMVVPNSSPAKSVAEFIAHARQNRGKITFASSGTGTSPHLSGELFKRRAGIEMTHIPYRGVAPALNDVIPGRVDVMFNTMAGVLQAARSGQVRGLAVTSAERFPTAPEFPTVAESGVPGFNVEAWYSFFVPARTPSEVIGQLHADTVKVLAEPVVRQRMQQIGLLIVASTPSALGAHLTSESALWAPVIKSAGIKGED